MKSMGFNGNTQLTPNHLGFEGNKLVLASRKTYIDLVSYLLVSLSWFEPQMSVNIVPLLYVSLAGDSSASYILKLLKPISISLLVNNMYFYSPSPSWDWAIASKMKGLIRQYKGFILNLEAQFKRGILTNLPCWR